MINIIKADALTVSAFIGKNKNQMKNKKPVFFRIGKTEYNLKAVKSQTKKDFVKGHKKLLGENAGDVYDKLKATK